MRIPRTPKPTDQTVDALKQIPKIRSAADAFDVAMAVPAHQVDAYVRKLAQAHPDATIEQLQAIATRTYIARAGTLSGAVGAGAAFPGAGTVVAGVLTVAELASFYLNTTLYVLAMAKLQGLTPQNQQQRRALVASALLGDEGAKIVSDQLGLSTLTWARSQLKNISSPTLATVNKKLAKYAAKRAAKKTTSRAIGRLFPFGIGMVFGFITGRGTAKGVVKGLRTSLGPARAGSARTVLAELAHPQPEATRA